MAASNYSVNIKLNTKPAIDQLGKLEKRVNVLRRKLNTPLRIESKAVMLKKQQLALDDRKFATMKITRRLGEQLRKLEKEGLNVDKEKLQLSNAARHTAKGRLETARASNKLVADEIKALQKVVSLNKKAGDVKLKAASPTVVSHPGLVGPHKATKGAGQAAQDIDFLTKQQQKRLGFETKLQELEAKGVKVKKLRVKMGKLVDAQNRAELGSIKQLNAQIDKGIKKEFRKLNILKLQNKQRLESNKLLASESVAQGAFSRLSDRQSRDADGNRTFMNNPFSGFMGRRFGTTRGFHMQSAMISGGFPLLFGQGPIGAAAGGIGGGIGGMFGQMGGFAGGIIATAAVQSLANVTNSMNEFGAALNDPAENLDKLVERIGKFDKEVVESISQLKNAGLTQVAGELASLTMQQQFTGIKAIKNLNNEMSKFQRGTADLGTRISILVAGPLTLLFKALNLLGGSADKAVKDLTSTGKIRQQQEKLDTDLAKEESLLESIRKSKTELLKIPAFQQGGNTAVSLRANISLQEKALEKTRESIKGNSRLLEIRKLQRQVLLSEGRLLEDQIGLEKLKAQVTRGTEDEKAVALKQKQIDMQKVENKLLKERANLKSLLNNTKATKAEKEAQEEKIKNLEREFKLVQIIANERINAADPAISRIDELNRKMRDLNDLVKQSVELSKVIGESFADSFKGVIKGTMSVQEAFRNMLNRIADYFLDVAAQMAATALQRSLLGLLGGIFNFSTTPLNDIQNPNTRLAANGGPVGMKNPYIVGERGPELFVPNQSGNIIPNHDLAGIGGGGTNIVVNVDASGSSVEGDEAQAEQLGQAISQAIQAELIQQQRPGGLLYS